MFSEKIKNKRKWDPSTANIFFCVQKCDLFLCFILKRCEGERLEIKLNRKNNREVEKKLKLAKTSFLFENVIRNIN